MSLFSWIKGLFGGGGDAQEESGLKKLIGYDPSLVETLKGDHQDLLREWKLVLGFANHQDWENTRICLESFGENLEKHLTRENLRFYAYLDQEGRINPEKKAVVQGFKSEMVDIGRTVMGFLKTYTRSHDSWTEAEIAALPGTLDAITKALASRIDREENELYTLYHDY